MEVVPQAAGIDSPQYLLCLPLALLERSAREALLRNPNKADAYLVLADTCARRRNYQEQIQDLDTYLKLDPAGPASKRAHEVREVAQKILNRTQSQDPVQ